MQLGDECEGLSPSASGGVMEVIETPVCLVVHRV